MNRLYILLIGITTLGVYGLSAMDVTPPTHYEILGVAMNADQGTITKAFNQLAGEYLNQEIDSEEKKTPFQEVSKAYSVLKDPVKRKAYDATLHQNICLTSATDSLEGIRVTPPSEEEAEISELSLFVCFKSATEAQNVTSWRNFFEQYKAHIDRFEKYVSCKHLSLLTKCGLLLLSQVVETNNKQHVLKIKEYNVLMTQESSIDVRNELRNAILSCKKSLSSKHLVAEERKQLFLKEIKVELERYFSLIEEALNSGAHQKVELLKQKIALMEPGLELVAPGLVEYTKTLFDSIHTIDRIDPLSPRDAIACLQHSFNYLAQRHTNIEEWFSFMALCDVALEKWGRQKEILYLQLLAHMVDSEKAAVQFRILLNLDLIDIQKYIKAHRLDDVAKRLTRLKIVQENYERLFNKEMPRSNEVKDLMNLYL